MLLEDFKNAAGIKANLAARWFVPVEQACMEFAIVNPARLAAFIAQIGHESVGFMYTKEIWGPTSQQLTYEGRKDLGNTQPGDGKRFLGRGLIQITGRANYITYGAALGIDAISSPELFEEDIAAARVSGAYWLKHGCNEKADAGDFDGITISINGGLTGAADRRNRWAIAKNALGL